MHLLFTDPSTSPRTELGRIIFGVLYGLSTVALYTLLGARRLPTFLRQAPAGPGIESVDQADRSGGAIDMLSVRFDPAALGRGLAPRRRHLAYMAVWAMVFAAMSAAGGSRRQPSWPMAAVLAAGMRGKPPACVLLPRKRRGGLL